MVRVFGYRVWVGTLFLFLLYDSYRLAVAAEFAQTQQNKQNMLIT